MKIRARVALLALIAALCGCSSGSNAILRTVQDAVARTRGVADAQTSPQLNPNFRYLRVMIAGRAVFVALGYEDRDSKGTIEVWYSAAREVLRIQNGRLVGALGLVTEWRNVELPPLPSWAALAHSGQPYRWTRMRDVMPGYRFGLREALLLRVIAPPKNSELQGVDPQSLTWFEEQVDGWRPPGWLPAPGRAPETDSALPPARYAVDLRDPNGTVVYGEQCLAPAFCFTWQRWKP